MIRETISQLGKAIQSSDSGHQGEFDGFHMSRLSETAFKPPARPSLSPSPFSTEENQLLTTRSRGSAEMTIRGLNMDTLLDRINEKDRLLRQQAQLIAQLQDERDQLKGRSQGSRNTATMEKEALEKDLDREKALRIQAERRLHEANIEFKGHKARETSKANPNTLEMVWKTDLIALQTKLEEITQQKVKLMEEKSNLQTELHGNEVQILKLREEIRAAGTKYRELEGKEAEEMAELRLAQREVVKLRREKGELERKSSERSFESEELLKMRQKVLFLESELTKIQAENDNLHLELESRPTQKQLKSKEKELHSLLQAQNSPKDPLFSPIQPVSAGSVDDTMAVLGVKRPGEVIPALVALQRTNMSAQRLIGRLSALIKDCSVSEKASKTPSNKEIWGWTRRIAEEYMKLSKEQTHTARLKATIEQISSIVGVSEGAGLAKAVEKVVEEGRVLGKLVELLRRQLNVSPRVSFEELMQHLGSQ